MCIDDRPSSRMGAAAKQRERERELERHLCAQGRFEAWLCDRKQLWRRMRAEKKEGGRKAAQREEEERRRKSKRRSFCGFRKCAPSLATHVRWVWNKPMLVGGLRRQSNSNQISLQSVTRKRRRVSHSATAAGNSWLGRTTFRAQRRLNQGGQSSISPAVDEASTARVRFALSQHWPTSCAGLDHLSSREIRDLARLTKARAAASFDEAANSEVTEGISHSACDQFLIFQGHIAGLVSRHAKVKQSLAQLRQAGLLMPPRGFG